MDDVIYPWLKKNMGKGLLNDKIRAYVYKDCHSFRRGCVKLNDVIYPWLKKNMEEVLLNIKIKTYVDNRPP